jgi:predicted nucleotidyltransferase
MQESILQMLREMFAKVLSELPKICLNVYGNDLITLAVFGSVGRGTPNPFSDVDCLIVAENLPDGRLSRIRQFEPVEQGLSFLLGELRRSGIETSLAPVLKTPAEVLKGSLLFLDMLDDARLLFDRDVFFQGYLEHLKQRLELLGAKKVNQGQRWHWVLKPDYQPGEVIEL